MSSKLTIPHHSYRTPSLKRNTQQHCMLRDSAKRFEELPIQSRLQIAPSCLFETRKLNIKSRILDDSPTKDGKSSVSSTLTEERAENSSSQVVKINNLLEEVIQEDLKTVQRRRQRLGYGHTYEERESLEEVWIGQPKQIPQEVFEAVAECARLNNEKINCQQGFLSEIGVFYYSIEDLILFFDADTMNSRSVNICPLKLNQRPLYALYGIQLFTLGIPYLQAKRNVMVMLHPYEAQFYHYEITQSIDNIQRKILKLRSMGFRFPLPQKKPNKFSLSSKGYLYTTDNKGKIYKVDFQDQFWNVDKKELQARNLNISALTFAKNTAKRLTNSLASFYRSVKNYSLSFFASKETETQILFDEDKEIIVVFIKQRSDKFRERKISQHFHIYDEKSNELLYILKDSEFLRLDKQIVLMKKLEIGDNIKYNFILLLKSGQRVLLDLQNDRLKKHTIIKQPPLSNSEININRSVQISAFFLDQTIMAQITSTYNSYLVLTKQSSQESESVLNLKVESSQVSYVYHKKLIPFGQRKKIFLNYDKSKQKIQNWPQICRQVFYSPHQIYYSTDQIIQNIKILRPIDIMISIFTFFSENIPNFFKNLKNTMPQLTNKEIICLFCQILVDPEGIYYVSSKLQNQSDKRTNIPQRQTSNELRKYSFRDIDRKDRIRLIQIMLDCAVNAGSNKDQRQKILIEGIIQYYGKLLRCIYLTNINMISSETCKVVSCVLQQLRKFLLQLQGHFKCDLNSYIGATLKWVNKSWQILILSKDIPDLPDLTLHDAIIQDSRSFQPHIFRFLIKQCNEEVFHQIKKLMPCLVSNQFTILYHLYCEISPMKDLQAILAICKKHTYIPDYFIQYLVKSKKITEAILLKQSKMEFKDKQGEKRISYNQKMKQFYSERSSLYEKEQLLILASIILSQQSKRQQKGKKEQQQQLKTLKGQLKLQELMIQYYYQRVANKTAWTRIISKFLDKNTVGFKEQEIIDRLNTCLLDHGFLYEIIEQLDCNMLKVMYTYYFDPSSFQAKFFDLARQIFDENNLDLQSLNTAYQNELHFMLVKAKLSFKFEQIPIILHAYITLLAQSPSLQEALTIESSLIKKELFWPLTYSAEIGIDALKLYKWALSHLSQLDKHSQEYLYLVICCTYLVRDYLSEKKNDFINLIKCDESLRPELKQVYTLILA